MDSDNDQTEIATAPAEEALIHQGAKLVLGTLAGFLAGVAVRITYDAVRERLSSTEVTVNDETLTEE